MRPPAGTVSRSIPAPTGGFGSAVAAMTLVVGLMSPVTGAAQQSLPRFSQLQEWEQRSAVTADSRSRYHPALTLSVAQICRYFGAPLSAEAMRAANRSPLEWPPVFKGDAPSPKRQRVEVEALLAAAGLVYRDIASLDPGPIADTMATAIFSGAAVLVNAPGLPVVFGYDWREPDHWWWVENAGNAEIVMESERISRFVYWNEDPASGMIWIVTGVAASHAQEGNRPADDHRFLGTIDSSVHGNPNDGIVAYPLSIRRVRELAEGTDSALQLAEPIDVDDPLGIYRAVAAREDVGSALERLIPAESDTNVSSPLRLALYSFHSSLQDLQRLGLLLYTGQAGTSRADGLRLNWADQTKRRQVGAILADVLKWEKQGMEAVDQALQTKDKQASKPAGKPKPKPKPKPKSRSHVRHH